VDRGSKRLSGWAARVLVGLLAAGLVPGTVMAGGPDHEGPFVNEYSFIGFGCGSFDVLIEGAGSDEFTIWTDASGEVERVLYRARYPHDTLTNTVTGRSIVVRAAFEERIVRIPGTDEYTKTITGFRYLVNEPGTGVVIRDVGRIVYGDLDQSIVLWQAGEHNLALDDQFEAVFCAALA
jgi:hypothetical protein